MIKKIIIITLISIGVLTFLAVKFNQDRLTKKIIESNKIQPITTPLKKLELPTFDE